MKSCEITAIIYKKYTNNIHSIIEQIDGLDDVFQRFVRVVLSDCLVFVSDYPLDGNGVQFETIALRNESVPCVMNCVIQFKILSQSLVL